MMKLSLLARIYLIWSGSWNFILTLMKVYLLRDEVIHLLIRLTLLQIAAFLKVKK